MLEWRERARAGQISAWGIRCQSHQVSARLAGCAARAEEPCTEELRHTTVVPFAHRAAMQQEIQCRMRMEWSHELAAFGAAASWALDFFRASALTTGMWCCSLGSCSYQCRRSPGGLGSLPQHSQGAAKPAQPQPRCGFAMGQGLM